MCSEAVVVVVMEAVIPVNPEEVGNEKKLLFARV